MLDEWCRFIPMPYYMAYKRTLPELLSDEVNKAIPKMAKGANSQELQDSLQAHLEAKLEQLKRLEAVAQILKINPTGKRCSGVEGVIQEGAEVLAEEPGTDLLKIAQTGADVSTHARTSVRG